MLSAKNFQNWNWKEGTEFSFNSFGLTEADGFWVDDGSPFAFVLKRFCIVLKSVMLIGCTLALFEEFERPKVDNGSIVVYCFGVCIVWGWPKFIVLNMFAIVLKSIGLGSGIERDWVGSYGLVYVCWIIYKMVIGELVVGTWVSVFILFVANIICIVLKSAMLKEGVLWVTGVVVGHNSSSKEEAFGGSSDFFGS